MDPMSIMRNTVEIANQALAFLSALGIAVLLMVRGPMKAQWRLLARGPRWGNVWKDFEAEERADRPTSKRRAA